MHGKRETTDKIIIHCSDCNKGDANLIHRWHKGHGWDRIGYHFVINRTYMEDCAKYGRLMDDIGAHCYGQNETSIGICLIGKDIRDDGFLYSEQQTHLLRMLIGGLRGHYGFWLDICGHNEFTGNKTCPNFDVKQWLRMGAGRV